MTRPLYRWKSFWLGVLVLAFLGWAWVTSIGSRHELILQWDAYKNLSLSQANGRLIGSRYNAWNQTIGIGEPLLSRYPMSQPEWWPAAISTGRDYLPTMPGSFVTVAHWFPILLFLVPWSDWLAWRWRRLRRIQT